MPLELRNNFIDVKAEGAVGDGTADDTAAIQAALNAVPANGGIVNFPPGNYVVNSPLILKRGTTLRGTHTPAYFAGGTTVTSSCKILVGPAWTGTDGQGLIHCNNTGGGDIKNIAVENLALSGEQRAASGGGVVHGVRFPDQALYNGEQSWRFRDVSIGHFTGSGTFGRLHVGTWLNSYLHNCMRYGVEVANVDRWNDVKIINTYYFFNRMGGVLFAGGDMTAGATAPTAFVTFTNCRFERSGQVFGFPTNSPTQPGWVANAAGIRMSRARLINLTSCSTDANTGAGFDVLAVEAGASAVLGDITFVSCFANRDGGTDQTTLSTGTESSGFRVQGFTSTDGDVPKDIHFVGCDSATGGSSDTGGSTVISPAYGGSFQNGFFIDWIVGRATGVTTNMRYAGDIFGSAFLYNDAGVAVMRNRLGVTAEVGSGSSSQTFWQSDATAGVTGQGLNLPSALTELDAAVLGTRQVMSASDLGIQVQIAATIRAISQNGTNNIVVSIRDTAATGNVLASVTLTFTANGTIAAKSGWITRPSWFTGDKTLAVYTEGGDGADDYIIKNVVLRWKGGGA